MKTSALLVVAVVSLTACQAVPYRPLPAAQLAAKCDVTPTYVNGMLMPTGLKTLDCVANGGTTYERGVNVVNSPQPQQPQTIRCTSIGSKGYVETTCQ